MKKITKLFITILFVTSYSQVFANDLTTSANYLTDNHQKTTKVAITGKIAQYKDQSFYISYEKARNKFKKVDAKNNYDMLMLSYIAGNESMSIEMGYGIVNSIYTLTGVKEKTRSNAYKFLLSTKIYEYDLIFKPTVKYMAFKTVRNDLFDEHKSVSKDIGLGIEKQISDGSFGVYIANRRNEYGLQTVKAIDSKKQFGTYYSTIILNPYYKMKISEKSNVRFDYETFKINDLQSHSFGINIGYNF